MNWVKESFKSRSLKEFGIKNPLGSEKMTELMYNAVVAIEGKDNKVFWQKIGAAFQGKKGITIKLNALPLTDTIQLFPPDKKDDRKD